MVKTLPKVSDPLDVNARLYRQIAKLLDELEQADDEHKMTLSARISALIAIGRIQIMFKNLRKGDYDGSAGSKVRQYATAFQAANATRGGKNRARPTVVRIDRGSDDIPDDDDDPDAA